MRCAVVFAAVGLTACAVGGHRVWAGVGAEAGSVARPRIDVTCDPITGRIVAIAGVFDRRNRLLGMPVEHWLEAVVDRARPSPVVVLGFRTANPTVVWLSAPRRLDVLLDDSVRWSADCSYSGRPFAPATELHVVETLTCLASLEDLARTGSAGTAKARVGGWEFRLGDRDRAAYRAFVAWLRGQPVPEAEVIRRGP